MSTVAQWWKAAGIRALKTCAETAVGVILAQMAAVAADSVATMSDINWWVVLGAAVLAAVVSLLVSIAGIPEVDDGDSLPDIIEDGSDGDSIDTDAEVHDEDDQVTADNDDDAGDDIDDGDGDDGE